MDLMGYLESKIIYLFVASLGIFEIILFGAMSFYDSLADNSFLKWLIPVIILAVLAIGLTLLPIVLNHKNWLILLLPMIILPITLTIVVEVIKKYSIKNKRHK
ncbi:hypothetical protein [Enterococcus sp. AZ163]|uniref:hypothetical protein n=1 Tax=Enterococcus sp. AZ163 TaxID=2774638 RepID=UPI003D2BCBB0